MCPHVSSQIGAATAYGPYVAECATVLVAFTADGGLCGLENSVSHGAMLHFGPDVASKAIAKTSSSDPDLLKLMPAGSMSKKKPKKSKVRRHENAVA